MMKQHNKIRGRLLAAVLAVVMVLSTSITGYGVEAAGAYGETGAKSSDTPALKGSGTAEDPYKISNAAELKVFAGFINSDAGTETEYFYIQTEDIDLSQSGSWTPVGKYRTDPGSMSDPVPYRFSGTYDGSGHKVTGMKLSGDQYLGFFGILKGAVVKNLTVEGSIESTGRTGNSRIGGIAASSEGEAVSITGCTSDVDIDAYGCSVGGIIGQTDVDTKITNCVNAGDITLKLPSKAFYTSGIGGIAGLSNGDDDISGCINTGNIKNTTKGSTNIGGILGFPAISADISLTDCYNTGDISDTGNNVSGTITGAASCGTGGIVGKRTTWFDKKGSATGNTEPNDFLMKGCYNTGSISNSSEGNIHSGAIAGYALEQSSYKENILTDDNSDRLYALKGRSDYIICGDDMSGKELCRTLTNVDWFTAGETAELAAKLGDGFTTDTKNINDGFPVLKWQVEEPPVQETPVDSDLLSLKTLQPETGMSAEGLSAVELTDAQTAQFTAETTWTCDDEPFSGKFREDREYTAKVVLTTVYDRENTCYVFAADAASALKTDGSRTPEDIKVSEDGRTLEFTLTYSFGESLKKPETDETGAYVIKSASELAWYNRQATGISMEKAKTMSSADIKLAADIDMTGFELKPVSGTERASAITAGEYYSGGAYTGTFDGQGHMITNLVIDRTNKYVDGGQDERADAVGGLFGYTAGAVIKDLGIAGEIKVTDACGGSGGNYLHIGGVAGFAQRGTKISGCSTDMDITMKVATYTDSSGKTVVKGHPEICDTFIGGITGSMSTISTASETKIENCWSKGRYYGEGTRTVNIGGITGCTRSGNNVISRCYSSASIEADADIYASGGQDSYLGGIAGKVNAVSTAEKAPDISYCFALNEGINGHNGKNTEAGRVVGSGSRFRLEGKDNFGLKNMVLEKVKETEHDDEASGYSTSWGRDITSEDACRADEYRNKDWSEDIWNLMQTDGYPVFVWQKASAPPHKHDFQPTGKAKEATCTEPEQKQEKCEGCGRIKWVDVSEALGHDYQKTETSKSTCTEKGAYKYICTRCGDENESKAETIPALGHTGGKATDRTKAVCTRCGESYGELDPSNPEIKAKLAGTKIKVSSAYYKVTKSDVKKGTVQYLRPTTSSKTLKSAKIPATVKYDRVTYKVTSVAPEAFRNRTKLKTVTIGSNVTTIGSSAFRGCKTLKTVSIGSSVTTIGSSSFRGCTSLTKITIPSKVTKINSYAFYGDKKLKTVTVKTKNLKTVGKSAVKGIYKKAVVKVPKSRYSKYKKLFSKNTGFTKNMKIRKY